ncbi:hypothetical protein EJ576_15635 [Pseudomonas sp. C 49-2]|nr:hypothetical protein EJ576_15635 [Pseudomonas sp. C 49-2]
MRYLLPHNSCGSWLACDSELSVDECFADPPLSQASQLPHLTGFASDAPVYKTCTAGRMAPLPNNPELTSWRCRPYASSVSSSASS